LELLILFLVLFHFSFLLLLYLAILLQGSEAVLKAAAELVELVLLIGEALERLWRRIAPVLRLLVLYEVFLTIK